MLELKNLSIIRRHRPICEGLNRNLNKGGTLIISGNNGSGKSSLMETLLGRLSPSAGAVLLDGHNMSTLGNQQKKTFYESIGYVSQWPQLRPLDAVRQSVHHSAATKLQEERMMKFLELDQKSHLFTQDLSYAQQRRLDLGRSLVHQPKLLFWDEPFLGLDEHWKKQFIQALKELQELGTTIIISTVTPNDFASFQEKEEIKLSHNSPPKEDEFEAELFSP